MRTLSNVCNLVSNNFVEHSSWTNKISTKMKNAHGASDENVEQHAILILTPRVLINVRMTLAKFKDRH